MILNLRPAPHRDAFHRLFGGFGLPIVDCPLLRPEAINDPLPAPDDFDAVIFTSQIALDFFPVDPTWRTKTAYAVGAATAAAARAAGFEDVVCTGQDAADLAALFQASDTQRAFYPSAEEPAVELAAQFPERVARQAVYRMIASLDLPAPAIAALGGEEVVYAPSFSRRTTLSLVSALSRAGVDKAANLTVIGISRAAVELPSAPWGTTLVALEPTAPSIADTLAVVVGARRAA